VYTLSEVGSLHKHKPNVGSESIDIHGLEAKKRGNKLCCWRASLQISSGS
jgi:hypothetical protein